MSGLPYEDYYAGKNCEYKEKDDSIFKSVFNFGKGCKKTRLLEAQKLIMGFYIQNQSMLSSMRHLMDKVDILEAKIDNYEQRLKEKKDV